MIVSVMKVKFSFDILIVSLCLCCQSCYMTEYMRNSGDIIQFIAHSKQNNSIMSPEFSRATINCKSLIFGGSYQLKLSMLERGVLKKNRRVYFAKAV